MKLSDIAEKINGQLHGDNVEINSIRSLDTATSSDLTILLDKKHLSLAQTTKAIAIISPTLDVKSKNVILVENPRNIFVRLLNMFTKDLNKIGIAKTAVIHKTAKIGKNVYFGEYVAIEEGAVVCDGVYLDNHVSIGQDVQVGSNTKMYSGVKVYDGTKIGCNCILHSGAVLGSTGFGFEPDSQGNWQNVPQLGVVVLKDNVEIGANSCVDRGAIQDTIIGNNTKIDNLVHIAHNCIIGENNAIAAMSVMSGSTKIGDNCMIAGQVGIAGHLSIGNNVVAMGRAGITKNIRDGSTVYGFPAEDYKKSVKDLAILRRLIKKELKRRQK